MRFILLLILIAASLGVFFMLIKPKYENLKTIKAEVVAAQANVEIAKKLKESREELNAKYQAIPKTDLDNLKTLLPDSVDNIRLIIQIDALAKKNALTILKSVDYKTEQIKTVDTSGTIDPAAENPYGEITISFQTSGPYKKFLTFLSDLEQNLRMVDVTEVSFVTAEKDDTAGGMTYRVTLKTYWLKQ